MADDGAPGRRERKKAATRKAISDAATLLFIERGFDAVTIKEVAERADVSPATVYLHFPRKEALVYDEDEDMRDELVAAVHERAAGIGINESLRRYYHRAIDEEEREEHAEHRAAFEAMVAAAPTLQAYAEQMWARHRDALAQAVAEELGRSAEDPVIQAYARFVLQVYPAFERPAGLRAAVDAIFDLLEHGWSAVERGGRPG